MVELHHILKSLQLTTILVTHDQMEAFAVADRIIIMNRGRIEQIDTPQNIYKNPRNTTVAKFLGFHNVIEGRVDQNGQLSTPVGSIPKKHTLSGGDRTTVLLRPESAVYPPCNFKDQFQHLQIKGKIVAKIFQGDKYKVSVRTPSGTILTFHISNETNPPGLQDDIELTIRNSGIELIDQ